MRIIEWAKELFRPTESLTFTVPVTRIEDEDEEAARDREALEKAIKSIEVRLNLIEDEAEIIYRR